MTPQSAPTPSLSSSYGLTPDLRNLCESINKVADGLPVLLFIPSSDHSRLFPLVVVRDDATEHARLIEAFLEGERMNPPSEAMQRQQDLLLEAIHAAADYLPAIVFLPAGKTLHPINLVPEVVPASLQPCYVAVQHAQKSAIGKGPITVPSSVCG